MLRMGRMPADLATYVSQLQSTGNEFTEIAAQRTGCVGECVDVRLCVRVFCVLDTCSTSAALHE